ncbi:hypothetical protein BpHYR1_043197 [Brachionus plicatilis]|uniref:Uncharacterized protein n=1 Tax=Brachionus plicatilis TaxID=10195 RepID=A0A3M7SLV2_BRAPC|nr:hypothetical protein BpHYR1_043197 [Brachionus plicatilis]
MRISWYRQQRHHDELLHKEQDLTLQNFQLPALADETAKQIIKMILYRVQNKYICFFTSIC